MHLRCTADTAGEIATERMLNGCACQIVAGVGSLIAYLPSAVVGISHGAPPVASASRVKLRVHHLLPVLVLLALPPVRSIAVKGAPRPYVCPFEDFRPEELAPGEQMPLAESMHNTDDYRSAPSNFGGRYNATDGTPPKRRNLFHSSNSRVTQMTAGGGSYDREISWRVCFGPAASSCTNTIRGAFAYASQTMPIGTIVTVHMFDSYGDGWDGAYFTGFDQWLTMPSGARSTISFTVGTFETNDFSAPQPPAWTVTSGSAFCSLTNGGLCVSDGPDNYANNERCIVTARRSITLQVRERKRCSRAQRGAVTPTVVLYR